MHPNQMYMQHHYPPHIYSQGHMSHQQYYNPGAVAGSPGDITAQGYHHPHHYVPHQHSIYPDGSARGYIAYNGMDGNVYYTPPPPPQGSKDAGEGKQPPEPPSGEASEGVEDNHYKGKRGKA